VVRRRPSLPVFVDRTGRRRRFLILVGVALGVTLLLSLGVLAVGTMGGGPVPLPGWPDGGVHAGQEPTSAPNPPAPAPTPGGATSRTGQPGGPVTPTTKPGQGDEHRRTAKPTRSPGRPG